MTDLMNLKQAIESGKQLKRVEWDNFVDYFAACLVQDEEGKIEMRISRIVDTSKDMSEGSEGFMTAEDYEANDYVVNDKNRSIVKFVKV